MTAYTSTTDLARQLAINPTAITNLFYAGVLDDRRCERVAGRRLIPRKYASEITAILRERGMLPAAAEAVGT